MNERRKLFSREQEVARQGHVQRRVDELASLAAAGDLDELERAVAPAPTEVVLELRVPFTPRELEPKWLEDARTGMDADHRRGPYLPWGVDQAAR